jgi:hypothetical protein
VFPLSHTCMCKGNDCWIRDGERGEGELFVCVCVRTEENEFQCIVCVCDEAIYEKILSCTKQILTPKMKASERASDNESRSRRKIKNMEILSRKSNKHFCNFHRLNLNTQKPCLCDFFTLLCSGLFLSNAGSGKWHIKINHV